MIIGNTILVNQSKSEIILPKIAKAKAIALHNMNYHPLISTDNFLPIEKNKLINRVNFILLSISDEDINKDFNKIKKIYKIKV